MGEMKLKTNSKKEDYSSDEIKKEAIRKYFEETEGEKLICVHILANEPNNVIPSSNSYDLRGYLGDLEDEGIIKLVRRERCAYSNQPHDTFKFVPKEERKEKEKGVKKIYIDKKPTQEVVFQAISSRYSVGDVFSSSDMRAIWKDKWHKKLSTNLYTLARDTDLLEKAGKDREGNNKYRLLKENYEDREWTGEREKEEKKEFETTPEEDREKILEVIEEETDGEFCIHDIKPKLDLERKLSDLLSSLEREGEITTVRDDYECGEYGMGHRLFRLAGMEEEPEEEEEPEKEVKELKEQKEETIEVPEKEAILLDKYYERRKNLLLLEILREIVKKLD